ncbi:hypothetical protein J6590_071190 [Homalodisca vitripennis]|nr:hypothetical protein J6590_071190 [Homalodisca vitripennis]
MELEAGTTSVLNSTELPRSKVSNFSRNSLFHRTDVNHRNSSVAMSRYSHLRVDQNLLREVEAIKERRSVARLVFAEDSQAPLCRLLTVIDLRQRRRAARTDDQEVEEWCRNPPGRDSSQPDNVRAPVRKF